ncbi:SseB family protein [Actinoplanes sp. NPDC049668]|uniref:SseB family protein n=1 Tax=unclassified Actinoplanes TaxID=2626549 RepID=UPI0033B71835
MVSDWRPATATEQAMLAAAQTGDRDALLAALVTGPLLMPVSPAAAEGREPPAWATGTRDGETYVLTFTSPEAIAACLPGQPVSYRTDSVPDVVASWPDTGWKLTVDLGLPIGLTLTADQLNRLPDLAVGGEDALRAAVAAQDADALTAAMLRAEMVVPVRPDGPPTRDLTDPEFPWWVTADATGAPAVAVFTSEERLAQALGDHDLVVVSSLQLAENWPDPSWQLSLNPGTPLAVQLPGTAVRELGGWLGELRTTMTDAYEQERRRLAAEEEAEPRVRPALAAAPSVARRETPYEPDPDAPLRLQLVIPPMYLSAYLEQGYDRAAGLVHSWYGPGRETPRRLYDRLDLVGEGSPFHTDDDWVVVLRWTPDEQTPAEWAQGGPRMESVVVPEGAGLHRIHADGRDVLVAVFDADARSWAPPAPG